jgi:8-amino-7-oxononanoate synthase
LKEKRIHFFFIRKKYLFLIVNQMNEIWQEIIRENLTKKQADKLERNLTPIEENQGREIQVKRKNLINFSANDYLGLSREQRVIQEAVNFAQKWGAGSPSSRLISGNYLPLEELENKINLWQAGAFQGSREIVSDKSVLIFNTGYHANLSLISSLADRDTVIFCDRLAHASIYDGIILSRAKLSRYSHNDTSLLHKKIREQPKAGKKIIITESLFSMDGDLAPLTEIAEIAQESRALFMVDEAHSMGLFGKNGSGLVNKLKILDKVDILMGTFGKGFGVFGAFAYVDEPLKKYLINNARPFIFTTALPPMVIGAISRSLDIIAEEKRGEYVLKIAAQFRELLHRANIGTLNSASQIVPVIAGSNEDSLNLMEFLFDRGFFAPAIRPPTVPANTSRVRISFSYYHTEADMQNLADAITVWFAKRNAGIPFYEYPK